MKKIIVFALILPFIFVLLSCADSKKQKEIKIYRMMRETYTDSLLKGYPKYNDLDREGKKLLVKYELIFHANSLLIKPMASLSEGDKRFLLLYLLAVNNPGHPADIDKQFQKDRDYLTKTENNAIPEP